MCYTVVLGASCDLSSSDLSLGPQSYVHSPCRCSGITHRYHTCSYTFNVAKSKPGMMACLQSQPWGVG